MQFGGHFFSHHLPKQFPVETLLFMISSYYVDINCSAVRSCRFTYTEDPNYGPYLESVNGVAGNDKDRTYWELLVETPDGKTIRPDVGKSTMKMSICQALLIWQHIRL